MKIKRDHVGLRGRERREASIFSIFGRSRMSRFIRQRHPSEEVEQFGSRLKRHVVMNVKMGHYYAKCLLTIFPMSELACFSTRAIQSRKDTTCSAVGAKRFSRIRASRILRIIEDQETGLGCTRLIARRGEASAKAMSRIALATASIGIHDTSCSC